MTFIKILIHAFKKWYAKHQADYQDLQTLRKEKIR
jgi:hypothetical protein